MWQFPFVARSKKVLIDFQTRIYCFLVVITYFPPHFIIKNTFKDFHASFEQFIKNFNWPLKIFDSDGHLWKNEINQLCWNDNFTPSLKIPLAIKLLLLTVKDMVHLISSSFIFGWIDLRNSIWLSKLMSMQQGNKECIKIF